jgi:hypothetical protein
MCAVRRSCGLRERTLPGPQWTLVKWQWLSPELRIFSPSLAAWSMMRSRLPRRPARRT